MANTILKLDASARLERSVTRALTQQLTDQLAETGTRIIKRDVGMEALPLVTEEWIGANFTPQSDRTAAQEAVLALSDTLIAELEAADTIILGVPVYNFGVPAAFKAWIDLIARARKTFKYTDTGPVGLLEGKTAYVLMASGGTQVGSDIDFGSSYIRHVLGFIGIHDVEIIAADQLMVTGEAKIETTKERLRMLAA